MDLREFFTLQSILNKFVGFDENKFRAAFSDCSPQKALGEIDYEESLLEAGRWIDDFLKAMSSEIEELRDCTFWKHWCSEAQDGERYKIKNVTSARNEVIDMLHFWISLAQVVGMTPEMVEEMYRKKLDKNIRRQVNGYSITEKDLAWKIYKDENPKDHPQSVCPDAESLEDLPDTIQLYYLALAKSKLAEQKSKVDGYSVEEKDLAWKLFNRHEYVNPKIQSLEDMLESDRMFWLNQARDLLKSENLCDTCVHNENDCSMAVGKRIAAHGITRRL